VQQAACDTPCNAARGSDTLRQAVVDAGALPWLVAAMRVEAGEDPELLRALLAAGADVAEAREDGATA
jgi:hypothetical protein